MNSTENLTAAAFQEPVIDNNENTPPIVLESIFGSSGDEIVGRGNGERYSTPLPQENTSHSDGEDHSATSIKSVVPGMNRYSFPI